MRIAEIRAIAPKDLQKRLASLREQLRTMRFKIASKEVKNNHQMREIKKDIARILTVLSERK